ncbi:MAG: tRNA (adenosine(37)-N6)-threonylcarbamoyltransferase complex dimerization subunit type 1 TsaB [Actinobacteria bacterium]|nr:tRNA (adenosine(37)-N6)-threonylcarbamoyltransferase complex dimerization subunit type 1 TsaB [Actinomycetota bacterium]
MYYLSIDSTTKKLIVNLSKDGEMVSGVSNDRCLKHMEKIMTHIDKVLREGHIDIGSIDVLGINTGPGDFTGTRIGISIVKTLSWVLDRPAYGINALDIFAMGIVSSNARYINKVLRSGIAVIIIPCLDVRREELYCSFYEIIPEKIQMGDIEKYAYRPISEIEIGSRNYPFVNISGNLLIQKDSFNKKMSELFRDGSFYLPNGGDRKYRDVRIIIGGNSVHSYKEMLSALTNIDRRMILDKKNMEPTVSSLIKCVDFLVKGGKRPQGINPVYVREFVSFGK